MIAREKSRVRFVAIRPNAQYRFCRFLVVIDGEHVVAGPLLGSMAACIWVKDHQEELQARFGKSPRTAAAP